MYLSAVVLQELNAGAGEMDLIKYLSKLERSFDDANRLVVPNRSDWSFTGRVLSGIVAMFGFDRIKHARLTHDCLIAMSARRLGLTVVTHNARDFNAISQIRRINVEDIS